MSTESIARTAGALGLAAFAAFQAALAAGAPWGGAAYGGAHPGTLPSTLRAVSAGAAVAYAALAGAVAAGVGRDRSRRVGLTALAVAMGAGTVLNAISPAPPEKAWSALCALIAVSAWVARPARRPRPAS